VKLTLRLFSFQEEDKEEMKDILEMKRVHERIVKKRRMGKKSAFPSPKKIDLAL